jgi:hypothetical protein
VGRLPPGVEVLALENAGDVVPHLDDATNPDRLNVTTVTIGRDHGSLSANHDLATSYLPAARELDASSDPAVRDYLAGLAGFLSAQRVRTHAYLARRSY